MNMKKMLFLLVLLCSFNALADNLIKVAVIDTGLEPHYRQFANLCPGDHKDFTGEGFNDYNGHGTNIVGLIVDNAKSKNYCIVLIKAYRLQKKPTKAFITEALVHAYNIGANVINLSGGGSEPIEAERQIVNKLLDKKITLVVAAGNEGLNLDKNCRYYPACYDKRIFVIGSHDLSSNYGPKTVDILYNGRNRLGFGKVLSGTSQSTATFTGKLLNNINLLQQGN
jgi:subtilisin family serine protease